MAKGVGKGVVEVVLNKFKQDGVTPYYVIVVDSKEYYDSKGVFKDKKGQEIEFEWADSNDGKITFINLPGSARSGGGGRAKSPEELKQQAKSFALSYAKDQMVAIIAATAHLVPELPIINTDMGERIKYLEYMHHLNTQAAEMTKATAVVYLKWLSE